MSNVIDLNAYRQQRQGAALTQAAAGWKRQAGMAKACANALRLQDRDTADAEAAVIRANGLAAAAAFRLSLHQPAARRIG